jgi:transcriptional regulator with XRE-family HTH domain
MARAALGWSTQELAKAADVGVNTVNRFEAGQDARVSSVEKMRRTLESAGVIFVAENGEGPGVRLRKEKPMTDKNFEFGYRNDLREHGFTLRSRPDGTYEISSGQYISAAGLTIEEVADFAKDAKGHRDKIQAEISKKRSKD